MEVRWHFLFTRTRTMLKESCFKIGFIQRTHGLKGEVTSVIDGDLPDTEFNTVFVDENNRLIPYFIKSFSLQGTKALIRFEDVDQLEQAKKLVGKAVYLQKTLRPRLGRGKFYDDEIIGFIVTETELEILVLCARSSKPAPTSCWPSTMRAKKF